MFSKPESIVAVEENFIYHEPVLRMILEDLFHQNEEVSLEKGIQKTGDSR